MISAICGRFVTRPYNTFEQFAFDLPDKFQFNKLYTSLNHPENQQKPPSENMHKKIIEFLVVLRGGFCPKTAFRGHGKNILSFEIINFLDKKCYNVKVKFRVLPLPAEIGADSRNVNIDIGVV